MPPGERLASTRMPTSHVSNAGRERRDRRLARRIHGTLHVSCGLMRSVRREVSNSRVTKALLLRSPDTHDWNLVWRWGWSLFLVSVAATACGFPNVSFEGSDESTFGAEDAMRPSLTRDDASSDEEPSSAPGTPNGADAMAVSIFVPDPGGPNATLDDSSGPRDGAGDALLDASLDSLPSNDASSMTTEGGTPMSGVGSSSGGGGGVGSSSGGVPSGSGSSSGSESPTACGCSASQTTFPFNVPSCSLIGQGVSGTCSPSGFVGGDPGCGASGAFLSCVPLLNSGGIVKGCVSATLTMIQQCH